MSKWPRFRNRKWPKWPWPKWPRVLSFLSCFFVVSRISCNFAISKPKAIWHRHGVSNITRWLQWNYCPLPTASCKVVSKPFCQPNYPCCIRNLVVWAGYFIAFCWPSSPSFLSVAPPTKTPFMRSWEGILTSLKVFFAEFRQYFTLFIQGKWVHFSRSSSEKRPILYKNRWKSWKSEPKTHHYG